MMGRRRRRRKRRKRRKRKEEECEQKIPTWLLGRAEEGKKMMRRKRRRWRGLNMIIRTMGIMGKYKKIITHSETPQHTSTSCMVHSNTPVHPVWYTATHEYTLYGNTQTTGPCDVVVSLGV
uniref:Uncharacterized protein n=1 Tax=Cacopsylla melanoneura TaxID=428564 RepID=A0A8D8Z151_9HEMI